MPDRYSNEDFGRRSGERRRSRPDRQSFGEGEYRARDRSDVRYGPTFGDRSTFDQGETYFGSGRMRYGEGINEYEPNRDFGYDWRDSTGHSNYDYPERRYESTRRRAGFGRDAFGLGYGGDWEPEANRRRAHIRNLDRYEDRYADRYGSGRYRPASETGFYGPDHGSREDRSWWDRATDEVSSWFGDEVAERRRQMDARGGYRGRGPKNYARSDERIKEDINDRLTDYDYIDATDVEVGVQNGEVVLSGTVDSGYEKRLAEDIADDVSGVRNVENRIRIRREQTRFAGSDLGYDDVTGHTELNRQEVNATQQAGGATESERARGKTTST